MRFVQPSLPFVQNAGPDAAVARHAPV